MSFYRAPINPGWDDFGARLAGGVQAGIGLYHDLSERNRRRRLEDEARVQAERMHGIMPAGEVPLEDTVDLTPGPGVTPEPDPMLRAVGAAGEGRALVPGMRPQPLSATLGMDVDLDGDVGWDDPRAYANVEPQGIRGALTTGTAPPRRVVRRRPVQSQDVGGGKRYVRGMDVGLQNQLYETEATRRSAAAVASAAAAERRQQEEEERRGRINTITAALVGQGRTPDEASRLALAAEYHVPISPTPAEHLAQRRDELDLEDIYHQRQEGRRLSNSLALRAAGGGAGGASKPLTPAQARAARKDEEEAARATAYRLIRTNPAASEQELFNGLGEYHGRVDARVLLDQIAQAQRAYSRDQGSGVQAINAERARQRAAKERQPVRTVTVRRGAGTTRPAAPAPPAGTRRTITAAEAAALKQRGYNDAQIRERYQVQP